MVLADRGYISKKLTWQLLQDWGIEFFAKPKQNMKNTLMKLTDKLLARKGSIVLGKQGFPISSRHFLDWTLILARV